MVSIFLGHPVCVHQTAVQPWWRKALAGFKGLTSKGREGRKDWRKGQGEEREKGEKGKESERRGGEEAQAALGLNIWGA